MSESNPAQLQQESQTHYNIQDYLEKIESLGKMPNPPSYSQPGSDYDLIRNKVKELIDKKNYFVYPNRSPELNIWFDNLQLLNQSDTLEEQTQLKDLISPLVTPEFTYIRPFFKYDENGNYGNVPLTQKDFIFILIYSILEHYTWKKPELIQTINNSLNGKNTYGLFSCLNVSLTPKDKDIIFEMITKLYEFGTAQGIPRKQLPTEESFQNKTDIFSYMNTLLISKAQNEEDAGPIIPNILALINLGSLILKKADTLISSKEKADYGSQGPLFPYVLIARQLAEAFHVTINLLILEMNPNDPNFSGEWINLKTSEGKLISPLNIFLTRNLNFGGKLIFQNYWNSEKIYNDLMQIKYVIEGKKP